MILNLQKYFEISTIHGLFYIQKRFHLVERIFWIIALTFSVFCTSFLIIELVLKIQHLPIIVYVSDESIPNYEINFPAVTVCPQLTPYFDHHVKIYDGDFQQYFQYEKHSGLFYFFEDEEFWQEEIKDERKIGNLEYSTVFDMTRKRNFGNFSYLKVLDRLEDGSLKAEDLGLKILKRLQVIDLITNRGTFEKLNFSIPTDDFLSVANQFTKAFDEIYDTFSFGWPGEGPPFLSEIITPYGICFNFNLAYSHDLLMLNVTSDDFRYDLHFTVRDPYYLRDVMTKQPDILPRRVLTSFPFGVTVSLSTDMASTLDNVVLNDFDGHLFIMHDSFELPTINSKILKIHDDHPQEILIEPQMNSIDDSISGYTPDERNCYLEKEKKLKFYKIYTKNNCEMECLTDYMLKSCGCVEFFMVRNKTTRICSASERNCFKTAQNDFMEYKSNCGCLERCNSVKYDYEVEKKGYGISQKGNNSVYLNIYQNTFIRYREASLNQFIRKKQFNELDFLSFVGGLLGLFAGFSALSFVELIYWFTIRLFIGKCSSIKAQVHPIEENQQVEVKKNHFVTYLQESTVHGLKFVTEFTKIDSIIWTIVSLLSLTFCLNLVLSAREKVPDSRVTAYEDNFKFVDQIPFPAFTLVPELKIPMELNIEDVEDFSPFYDKYMKLKDDQVMQDKYLRNLTKSFYCFGEFHSYFFGLPLNYVKFHQSVLKEASEIDWFRKQFSIFNGIYQPEFAEIRTSRGMAFTFNLIDADEMFDFSQISSSFRYARNVTTKSASAAQKFPNFTSNPLKFSRLDHPSLSLTISNSPTDEKSCMQPALLIHDADLSPTFKERKDFIHFKFGMNIDVEITPEVIKTDENLRTLSPASRECYFDDEMSLKFFKKYSQKNCEIECFANLTFKFCDCLDIHQPFGSEELICSNITKNSPLYCPFTEAFTARSTEDFSLERNCSCLPLCNSISYNIKIFAEMSSRDGSDNTTVLNVRMNMDGIVLFRRYQQFTFSDVLSYVGGNLGLFAGISMLSIVEFLYFFTIRLGVDFLRWIKRK